ncbi:MAG: PKD domain-containing protein [Elusimicrobia bacterium]|nr:PKD domain-containing protein [Candidatus Liberimonas magnetica]
MYQVGPKEGGTAQDEWDKQVADSSNFTHKNNVYYLQKAVLGFTKDSTELLGDPLFVNLSGDDLHIKAGSPAINAGINLGYTADYDNYPINAAPDLGAYEYVAAANLSEIAINRSRDGLFESAISTVTIPVNSQPAVIALNPAAFSFTAVKDGANPSNQTFNINNTGENTLNWSASATVSWLACSPASGSLSSQAVSTVTASVNTTSLSTGTYTGTITVTDPNASNNPQSVTVSLLVKQNQPPIASFTATPASGQAPLTVAFNASASSDPDGSITSYSWNFGDGQTGSGATASHVYITSGTFNAALTVTDNLTATNAKSIAITVSAKPKIALNPASLTLTATKDGANPAANQTLAFNDGSADTNNQFFSIYNIGGGSDFQWTATASPSWLLCSPSSGVSSATIAVSAVSSEIPPGRSTATISISVLNAINNPQVIQVLLDINSPPVFVKISSQTVELKNELSFTVQANDNDKNDSLSYTATNLPQGASFDQSTKVFSWVPEPNQKGGYTVYFMVTDPKKASDTMPVFIKAEPASLSRQKTNRSFGSGTIYISSSTLPATTKIFVEEIDSLPSFALSSNYKPVSSFFRIYEEDLSGNIIEDLSIQPTLELKQNASYSPSFNISSQYIKRSIYRVIPRNDTLVLSRSFSVQKDLFELTNTGNTAYISKSGYYILLEAINNSSDKEKGIIPPIITPNGDGNNDKGYFYWDYTANTEVDVKIFDYSGRLIKDNLPVDNLGKYWDGTDNDNEKVPAGIYIYQMKHKGSNFNGSCTIAK